MGKNDEGRLNVAKMEVLRYGIRNVDKYRNARISVTIKAWEVSKKIHESRLVWYGHVMSRDKAVWWGR